MLTGHRSTGQETVQVRPLQIYQYYDIDSTNYNLRMLEDPSHQDVARWGKDGDTFVVVEVSFSNQAYKINN